MDLLPPPKTSPTPFSHTNNAIQYLSGQHTLTIFSIEFDKNGKHVYSTGSDCKIACWNVTTGKFITFMFGHKSSIFSLSASSNYPYLASGGKSLLIFDTNTFKLKLKIACDLLEQEGNIHSLKFSSCVLACGHKSGAITIIQIANGDDWPLLHVILDSHQDVSRSLCFITEQCNILLTASQDGTSNAINVFTGQVLFSFPIIHHGAINSIVYHGPTHGVISASDDGSLVRFSHNVKNTTFEFVQQIENVHQGKRILCLALSECYLASGGGDGSACVFMLSELEIRCIACFSKHRPEHWILGVAFNSTGTCLAFCGEDRKVALVKEY